MWGPKESDVKIQSAIIIYYAQDKNTVITYYDVYY